jgi:rsbT co-antagonist protein RsbR
MEGLPTEISRRRVTLALLAIQSIAALLILIGQLVIDVGGLATALASGAAVAVGVALLAAAWRGWEHAGALNVVLVTLLVGIGTPMQFVGQLSALIVLVPAAVALILARPIWIIGSMVGTLAIYSLRNGAETGSYWNAYIGDVRTLATVILLIACMFLSRLIADSAGRRARVAIERANVARAEAEAQSLLSAGQAEELAAQNEQQSRLLALVADLEAPVVAVEAGVLLAALVGQLDERRLERIVRRLLDEAAGQRAALVILDVTGASAIDALAAGGLARAAQALRLIGCEVALTGLSPSVAQLLAGQGELLAGVTTLRAPEEALAAWRLALAGRTLR